MGDNKRRLGQAHQPLSHASKHGSSGRTTAPSPGNNEASVSPFGDFPRSKRRYRWFHVHLRSRARRQYDSRRMCDCEIESHGDNAIGRSGAIDGNQDRVGHQASMEWSFRAVKVHALGASGLPCE
jgi:hypothetical protein